MAVKGIHHVPMNLIHGRSGNGISHKVKLSRARLSIVVYYWATLYNCFIYSRIQNRISKH